MDNETKKLLMIVICFSTATKICRDIGILLSGVPFLLNVLSSPITGPLIAYFAHIILFTVTIIGSLIMPAYLIKYFIIKGRVTIGYDVMHHLFKPQLYCAILGIGQWALSLIFSIIVPGF